MELKKWMALAVSSAAIVAVAGCGGGNSAPAKSGAASGAKVTGQVTVSGSSALLPLAKDAAAKFKTKNPEVSLTLNAGGSGTGLKQVAEGSVNIGMSDVPAETKLPKEKAKDLVDHKVAVLTVAPVVNKDVAETVKSLTKQQLQDVFTAKVTNWKDVGGPDEQFHSGSSVFLHRKTQFRQVFYDLIPRQFRRPLLRTCPRFSGNIFLLFFPIALPLHPSDKHKLHICFPNNPILRSFPTQLRR